MPDKDAAFLPVVASSENHNGDVMAAYGSSSFWKRFTVGNTGASAENQTKRAMQSRHLMMIGE
jgi:amino acid permease